MPVRAAPRVAPPPRRPVKRNVSAAPLQSSTMVAEAERDAAMGGDRSRRRLPQRSGRSRGASVIKTETIAHTATDEPPRVWRGRTTAESIGPAPLKGTRPTSKDARVGQRARNAFESVPCETADARTNAPRPVSTDARRQRRNLQSSGSLSRHRDMPRNASTSGTPQVGLPKRASPLSSGQQFLPVRASPHR